MDQVKLNEYYKELIQKLRNISTKIIELNDLYNPAINVMNDSLVIDEKVIGQKELENVKKQSNIIKNELINQIIPNLKAKIK